MKWEWVWWRKCIKHIILSKTKIETPFFLCHILINLYFRSGLELNVGNRFLISATYILSTKTRKQCNPNFLFPFDSADQQLQCLITSCVASRTFGTIWLLKGWNWDHCESLLARLWHWHWFSAGWHWEDWVQTNFIPSPVDTCLNWLGTGFLFDFYSLSPLAARGFHPAYNILFSRWCFPLSSTQS